MEKSKEELNKVISLQDWIEKKFVNVSALIEKQVMLAIYHEFNDLFRRWFSILIEENSMTAMLDDSFSVAVSQDGHDTPVEYLSGGEKTSVALAYRLALNKCINDMVSEIKTKDILILDEPTDGFSESQLDKVRDVLEQLSIKQILIVSHESKIETFVDNVIRIAKVNSVSKVVC
jgi:exonuclease SbcC